MVQKSLPAKPLGIGRHPLQPFEDIFWLEPAAEYDFLMQRRPGGRIPDFCNSFGNRDEDRDIREQRERFRLVPDVLGGPKTSDFEEHATPARVEQDEIRDEYALASNQDLPFPDQGPTMMRSRSPGLDPGSLHVRIDQPLPCDWTSQSGVVT